LFAPSIATPRLGAWRPSRHATKVATIAALTALLVAFAVAGTVFFGLTIASPVSVPAAARQGIALSAMDLATAQRLGSVWWLFAAGAVLSFGAVLVTLGNLMRRLGDPSGE
jgi:hypothetical protein